jgi:uncharacterized protein YrrD
MIGLPVIELATGKELGLVSDLSWNHEQRRMKAICLETGGVICRTGTINCKNIVSIGTDAVTVADEAPGGEAATAEGDQKLAEMSGTLIVTEKGRNLGTLQGPVFDDKGESLLGYEISGGILDDLLSGRDVLPPEAVLTWGKENVVVRDAGKFEAKEDAK